MNNFNTYSELIDYYEKKAKSYQVDDNSVAFLVYEYLSNKDIDTFFVLDKKPNISIENELIDRKSVV